jgi:hypothetical protein
MIREINRQDAKTRGLVNRKGRKAYAKKRKEETSVVAYRSSTLSLYFVIPPRLCFFASLREMPLRLRALAVKFHHSP